MMDMYSREALEVLVFIFGFGMLLFLVFFIQKSRQYTELLNLYEDRNITLASIRKLLHLVTDEWLITSEKLKKLEDES